jgi:hypothetical protein
MPRIASLHSINQPSSSSYGNRRRRIDRNSYLHSPTRSRSRPTLRFPKRPHTLSNAHRQPTRPSFFTRDSQSSKRPSTTSWKSRLSFRSRKFQQPVQPLTVEEKLHIAANRIRKFERQTRPSTSPLTGPQARHQPRSKPKRHTRIHAIVLSKPRTHSRKRDSFQRRLNTFTFGRH